MISHCICFDSSFDDLKRLADEQGLSTLEQVQTCTGCGTQCGMCKPYIREMLRTGETRFFQLLADPPDSAAG